MQRACDILGFAPLEPIAFADLLERVHPEDREAVAALSLPSLQVDRRFRLSLPGSDATRTIDLKADVVCVGRLDMAHGHLLSGIVLM